MLRSVHEEVAAKAAGEAIDADVAAVRSDLTFNSAGVLSHDVIVGLQPLNKAGYGLVAPHPPWKTLQGHHKCACKHHVVSKYFAYCRCT